MMPNDMARPSVYSPEFKPYFEAVVRSSKGLRESARKMGYRSTSAVIHHMKKFGTRKPDHWLSGLPPKRLTLEYLESVVKTSKSQPEAAQRLGYRDPKMVAYHMRKMGIDRPEEWDRRPWLSLARRKRIPDVVIPTLVGRNWVAGLTQGEGCIQSRHMKENDATFLNLDVSMADSGPIFKFADYVGLSHPSKPVRNHEWKPNWHKNVVGLRALRVLQEILPFLLGEKRREAEHAIAFFSPFGNHRGCFRNGDIWPTDDFPSRTKGLGLRSPIPTSVDSNERDAANKTTGPGIS
jgi:hypothetical protein